MIHGIDVSFYQALIDYEKVAAAGITFATAQISFGAPHQQPLDRLEWAKMEVPKLYKSSIPIVGGYHWLLPGNIEAQVDHFISQMLTLFGGTLYGRICQLDVEWNSRLNVGPSYEEALLFAEIFAQKTGGQQLCLYYPKWYWSNTGSKDLTKFINSTLWHADYTTKSLTEKWLPYGGKTPEILQISSKGIVNGVSTNVDLDIIEPGDKSLYDILCGKGVSTQCTS